MRTYDEDLIVISMSVQAIFNSFINQLQSLL